MKPQKLSMTALEAISENKTAANQKALIYIHYAWLFRAQR